MAERKQFVKRPPENAELNELLEAAKGREVSEEELEEQRVSFAFGNAGDAENITKDSMRAASRQIRLYA
ncbi:hypothetical protein [Aurantiacibacter odishensis]|uniref:hypothetical protein n=1 Tax=Aurantiacibacter odishensis TaxID=1155476 RepID=UPI000E71459B|nr:hypothetical protein [Aurantiacibacter odishensis]